MVVPEQIEEANPPAPTVLAVAELVVLKVEPITSETVLTVPVVPCCITPETELPKVLPAASNFAS